jgi:DNA-binding NarL/FixJ family response regulator
MLSIRKNTEKAPSDVPVLAGLKVLIADDHHLVRAGLTISLKELEKDVTVLEADTLESAIDTYRAHPGLDLVLLDLTMPGTQGSTALDGFTQSCPEARIVVVSASYDMNTVQAAIRKGALGFIPKLAGKGVFINALRFVLEGGIYIPPEALMPVSGALAEAAPQLLPGFKEPPAGSAPGPRSAGLTARQIDVLAQLLDGKPNKQICRELNLAMGTVKCHVGAILGALEVSSRAEAIAAADKRGWREWLAQRRANGTHQA